MGLARLIFLKESLFMSLDQQFLHVFCHQEVCSGLRSMSEPDGPTGRAASWRCCEPRCTPGTCSRTTTGASGSSFRGLLCPNL